MITFPNAKINLGLNIVSRRPDGYHNIETVFYPIPLTDALEIVPSRSGATTLTCYGRKVDCPVEKNLVMKACRLLQAQCGLPAVDMFLYKHIPDGAGLGGGSSDASHVLTMLNSMFSLGLSANELKALASTLGADCAFFIENRPVMATGIGNVFAPVEVDLKGKFLFLVKPDVSVSTAQAYAQVTPKLSQEPLARILAHPIEQWQSGGLKNDFEPGVFAQFPELGEVKQAIEQAGALYCSMSGSGSSIFGIFDDVKLAEALCSQFAKCAHYVMPL